MRVLLPCVLVLVAGCKSQKLIAVETEVAAAKARLATLEKKRAELADEAKRTEVARKTFAQQADEAEVARQRLVAAGLVIHGDPVPDAVLLDEALRSKSPGLGQLAATIVQRQLPCASDEASTEEHPEDEDCVPPPVPDACEGVPERTVQSLEWSCADVVKVAGARSTVVCTANGDWPADAWPLDAPSSRVDAQMVRFAFEHRGRLFVADWPPPSLELYRPANDGELASCQQENEAAGCVRGCEDRFGRSYNPCAEGGYDGEMGDDGYDPDAEPENPDLAAARQAAQEAEAEAARAKEELAYQECLSGCESPGHEEDMPPTAAARLRLRKERIPGVFAFDVTWADATLPDGGALAPEVLVLGLDDAMSEVAQPEPPREDTVDLATQLLYVKRLAAFEGPDGPTWFGLGRGGAPEGVRLSKTGKALPEVLSAQEVCAEIPAAKQGPIAQRCTEWRAAPADGGAP